MGEERDYVENGNIKTQTVYTRTGTKQLISYTYYDDGRLWKRTYPDAGYVEYLYDGLGRRNAVIDSRTASNQMGGRNRMDWTFDSQGRVATVTLHDNRVITYSYNASGQRTEVK